MSTAAPTASPTTPPPTPTTGHDTFRCSFDDHGTDIDDHGTDICVDEDDEAAVYDAEEGVTLCRLYVAGSTTVAFSILCSLHFHV